MLQVETKRTTMTIRSRKSPRGNVALKCITLLLLLLLLQFAVAEMTEKRRLELKISAKEMFYHGWNNYMLYAHPHDELDPLRCVGRGADKANPHNTNINDALGDYRLTLVDTLDTLAIIGDQKEFERAVNLTIKHVKFDVDNRVQVFEVNIRALGGLLSAHLLATDSSLGFAMPWYKGELLDIAKDLGIRLLPAFKRTNTGIPWPRVNLRRGVPQAETSETCTAGAGSLILEFGVLSRLLNDSTYENHAKTALNALWSRRSELSLLGNVIDIQTGQWVHTASSTGAGIDSFFEYLLKAYVLFGEQEYLDMFNEAYRAIMTYVRDSTGYLYRNVHMTSGNLMCTWVDSLGAYFAGVQILAGDIDNAIKSHLLYYNIWKKYNMIPERFDFHLKNVNFGYYPLRPEFIESTYFLYRATRDPFYLEVGEMILSDLNTYTRVNCGFASVGDVRTKKLEGRMESFALSETFKYLYLLFDIDNMINRLDSNFVFTTEGHVFPLPRKYLKLGRHHSPSRSSFQADEYVCPAYYPHDKLFLRHSSSILSRPDADFVSEIVGVDESHGLLHQYTSLLDPYDYCELPNTHPTSVDVTFDVPNLPAEVREKITVGGIKLIKFVNGVIASSLIGLKVELTRRVVGKGGGYDITKVGNFRLSQGQVLKVSAGAWHTSIQNYELHSRSSDSQDSDSDNKVLQDEYIVLLVRANPYSHDDHREFLAYTSSFGLQLTNSSVVEAPLISLYNAKLLLSYLGCDPYDDEQASQIKDHIVLVGRGNCTFEQKFIHAQAAGARGIIFCNNDNTLFHASAAAEPSNSISIPAVMITNETGAELQRKYEESVEVGGKVEVTMMRQKRHEEHFMDTERTSLGKGIRLIFNNEIIHNLHVD